MSERTFFTLHYAVPGYTFIVMAVLATYPVLQDILFKIEDVTLVAAFLAFFSLLSGGALGFLISQGWYTLYNRFLSRNESRTARDILRRKYGLVEDNYHQIVFLDYVHRLNENEETKIFAQRRYDLMHLCGSTFFQRLLDHSLESYFEFIYLGPT